jgi:hypothetical protein
VASRSRAICSSTRKVWARITTSPSRNVDTHVKRARKLGAAGDSLPGDAGMAATGWPSPPEVALRGRRRPFVGRMSVFAAVFLAILSLRRRRRGDIHRPHWRVRSSMTSLRESIAAATSRRAS